MDVNALDAIDVLLAHPSFPWQEEALAVATHKPQVSPKSIFNFDRQPLLLLAVNLYAARDASSRTTVDQPDGRCDEQH